MCVCHARFAGFGVWHAGFHVSCPASIHGELVALALWSWYAACYSTFTCLGSNTWNLQSTRALHVTFRALNANVVVLACGSLGGDWLSTFACQGLCIVASSFPVAWLLFRHRGFTTRARCCRGWHGKCPILAGPGWCGRGRGLEGWPRDSRGVGVLHNLAGPVPDCLTGVPSSGLSAVHSCGPVVLGLDFPITSFALREEKECSTCLCL